MATVDSLGRATATPAPKVQTVTGFAVQSGTVDSDAPGVQETLREEDQRRKVHTEHAERLSRLMAPAETPTPVPAEEGGGQG